MQSCQLPKVLPQGRGVCQRCRATQKKHVSEGRILTYLAAGEARAAITVVLLVLHLLHSQAGMACVELVGVRFGQWQRARVVKTQIAACYQ